MGHVPEQSVTRTVAYASQQGARRFAALVPDGDYGRRTGEALSRAVAGVGGTLAGVENYDRSNTSIVSAAERLKAAGGYDAVLIAEGPRLAAMAAAALRDGGTQVYLLGTELWSGEAAVASSAALRGAVFSAVSDNRFRQFASSYETRFGEQPFRLATLGYDAVLLTLRIARDWQPGRDFPAGRMLAEDGFLGLDGPFRFRSNGIGERAMEVREVGNGTVGVVDPAPTRF
jgi:ABC-type branched-subunit amino acid transport system substrate-binding protein